MISGCRFQSVKRSICKIYPWSRETVNWQILALQIILLPKFQGGYISASLVAQYVCSRIFAQRICSSCLTCTPWRLSFHSWTVSQNGFCFCLSCCTFSSLLTRLKKSRRVWQIHALADFFQEKESKGFKLATGFAFSSMAVWQNGSLLLSIWLPLFSVLISVDIGSHCSQKSKTSKVND